MKKQLVVTFGATEIKDFDLNAKYGVEKTVNLSLHSIYYEQDSLKIKFHNNSAKLDLQK